MITADQSKQPHEDHIELEIAAFQGPHIKRTRILLALLGVFYLFDAYMNWGEIAEWRAVLAGSEGQLVDKVNLAYYFLIASIVVGVSNFVLAAIAGTKTTFAMYIAMALFVFHVVFETVVTDVSVFMDYKLWLMAIVMGFGFQAALKADKMRRERRPAEARLLAA